MAKRIATVGTFDGFHTGHRDVVERLCRQAAARGLEPVAVTFDRHPLASVAPDRVPPLLMDRTDLEHHLRLAGVDRTIVLEFTPELASLTAEQFMRMLHERHDVAVMLMGYDNRVGSDRPATPAEYVEAGRRAGIEVVTAPRYTHPLTGETPASTLLRRALAAGDTERFTMYAGRPYSVTGTVATGRRNGHRLGFPTLNIAIDSARAIPAAGVYAGSISLDGTDYPAVINVGHNPTIADANPLTVEAHALDADLGERYGSRVQATFAYRLRDEQRFDSLESLRDAIAADVNRARQLINNS